MKENNNPVFGNRIFLFLFFLIIFTLIGLFSRPIINVNSGNPENALSVSGQAEMEVDPDEAIVYFDVITEGLDAAVVQEINSQDSADMKESLIEFGIDEKNIETTSYYLYPINEWNYITQEYEEEGYRLTHTVKVTTERIDEVGSLINVAVDNGANGINNVQFTLSDALEKEVRAEALALAGTDARERAENIAESLGLKLGSIRTVSENNFYYTPYVYSDYDGKSIATGANEEYAVSPSKVNINSNIAVVFNIK